jgi:hypothetical protein
MASVEGRACCHSARRFIDSVVPIHSVAAVVMGSGFRGGLRVTPNTLGELHPLRLPLRVLPDKIPRDVTDTIVLIAVCSAGNRGHLPQRANQRD